MFNRLRAWIDRRIHGEPITPLSVLNSGPWTIDRINSELRGGFSGEGWGHSPFGHDSVQLAADFTMVPVPRDWVTEGWGDLL